ncbi:MAG TPA: UDP-N-acetylmuramoyl-tripeptide--D-alanyl-D-alanine ligase [Candidatus Avidesulfovibrio excrementigallinarum]|nr:UDP-N-acetylmuramoyl-tripeptide--D-alanyl-D-alanine ligase [Candidatus Avidesulfovibrio excrementigallinarum]
MSLDLDQAATLLHAERLAPQKDGEITSVAIDSRRCAQGSLFVCLQGQQADGHDFARQAVEQGASAILASRNPFEGEPPVPVLLVADPAAALRSLAADFRDRYARLGGTVIGLTGTAGKTTTKEILSSVLSIAGTVSRTSGNFNNSLGLPLSMLNADPAASWWVMELGISHPGDMDELASLLRPDMGLVLNAGAGHAEGLGERGVAWHKASLFRYLREDGTAIVSADYPDLLREASALRKELVLFSCTGQDVPYQASYLGADAGRGIYRLRLDNETLTVKTLFQGAFAAENLLAAATAAHRLGLSCAAIGKGLENAVPPAQRFARVQAGNWLVIDDSYNANPLSMSKMLEAAAEAAAGRPLCCVLGAMYELGGLAQKEHRNLGLLLAQLQPAELFWTGEYADALEEGLHKGGYAGTLRRLTSPDAFCNTLAETIPQGGVVLFKGSRSNHLEHYVTCFLDRARHCDAV